MERNEEILFSEKFQTIYDHLGLFSFLYILNGRRGIDPKSFMNQNRSYRSDTEEVLRLLRRAEIITERNGLFHLDTSKFYGMSVWDLLVLAEPWVETGDDAPSESFPEVRMLRTQNLSKSYMGAEPFGSGPAKECTI